MFAALSSSQAAAFDAAPNRLDPSARARVMAATGPGAEAAALASRHCDFTAPAAAADRALGGDAGDDLKRGLIAAWARTLPARVSGT